MKNLTPSSVCQIVRCRCFGEVHFFDLVLRLGISDPRSWNPDLFVSSSFLRIFI